ncbi:MAG: box helicase [Flaviaesturariibacter sp.]|nr:box helicase [Flaviaesturariibacter sp.]
MTFSDLKLSRPLARALDTLGYTTPTTIQQKVFSPVMSGVDICGIAQTGTGKTLAYLLPLINSWKYAKEKNPQVLVLVPTRELVAQVVETVQSLTEGMGFDVIGVYGGTNINTQGKQLLGGCDMLVGTPGRLYDLALSGAFRLKGIRKLVIDEVDEMLNLGFRPQLINILDLLPPRRQNLLFSATLVPEVEAILGDYFNEPLRLEAAPAGTPVDGVTQLAFAIPNFYSKVALLKLLLDTDESMSRVLVFVATKKLADALFDALDPDMPGALGVIHSNKEQNHRFNTVKAFRDGTTRVLIATDIVARGIDIASVSHIVNFDLPEMPEAYIHRIGRTGRADQKGIAYSFITEDDADARAAIEELMKRPIPDAPLPAGLQVTTRLADWEVPEVPMRELSTKLPKKDGGGAAFHEKSARNRKVNKRVSRKEQMKAKYGKPIKKKGKG